MTEHFRIAVAGAGPAGSTCANAYLMQGGKGLALLDRAVFPRDKCCGDGLGAGVIDVLERLDLMDIVADKPRISRMEMHFNETVHAEVNTTDLRRGSPLGYVIPRMEFDHALVKNAVERGAADFTGWGLEDAIRAQGRWDLRLKHAETDERRTITCDVLVGADGPRSRVRRALGVPFDDDEYTGIAVRGYVDMPVSDIGMQRLDIIEGMPHPGYCWLFHDGKGRANIGLGASVPAWKENRPKFDDLLQIYCQHLGDQISGTPEDVTTAILPTGFWRMRVGFPERQAALVGDAGSMVNPAAGEGIFFAMYAGLTLGEGLAQCADGKADAVLKSYDRAMKNAFGRNFRDSRILMKLLSNPKMLEHTMRNFQASPDFCYDFIEFLMGVTPPAKTRSLAGLALGAVMARFSRPAA